MGFTIVIGFAQPEAFAPNHFIIRPNAFYYEPSYAGCALAFSFLLLLASFFREKNWSGYWIPAVVLGAIVLTTSRGGILGLALGILTLAASFFFIRPRKELIVFLSKTVGLGLLLLLLFSIAPFGREYLTTLSGTEGVQASVQRMKLSSKSEGGRVDNFQNGISQWNRHLWLGDGAQTDPHDKKLFPAYENTWLEIGLESGLMGFLAFLFAVGSTILGAFQGERLGPALKLILAAAWIVHFGINLNLCQTFPRLDFWLLFYFSIYLLTKPNMEKA
jgi:O-antigen ligase